MKKIILFIMLITIFPIKINALEYESKLSGDNTISSMPDNENEKNRAYKNLYINITNIENIKSFDMYVKYDNSLIGLSTCNLLNYIGGGCSITSNKEVYYQYKHSNGYNDMFSTNDFYRVGFSPKESTPETGTTTVEVYFKNAIDKDSNPITIKSSSKTYTFTKFGFYLNKDNNTDETNNIITENNELITDTGTDIIIKSNNNYINKLEIKNHVIDFNKEINNYSIKTDNNINTLDISVDLEDDNATYEIIGADDLKVNNYKVLIIVTSESGIRNTYIINIKNDNNDEEKINTPSTEIVNKNNKINFNKDYLVYGIITLLFIILIIAIISYFNNKRIDKSFKGL